MSSPAARCAALAGLLSMKVAFGKEQCSTTATVTEHWLCYGDDFKGANETGSTLEDCCAACEFYQDCLYFTFDIWNSEGQPGTSCFLKTACSNGSKHGTAISGHLARPGSSTTTVATTTTTTAQLRQCPSPEAGYVQGERYIRKEDKASADECCSLCYGDNKCSFVTYGKVIGNEDKWSCYLYENRSSSNSSRADAEAFMRLLSSADDGCTKQGLAECWNAEPIYNPTPSPSPSPSPGGGISTSIIVVIVVLAIVVIAGAVGGIIVMKKRKQNPLVEEEIAPPRVDQNASDEEIAPPRADSEEIAPARG